MSTEALPLVTVSLKGVRRLVDGHLWIYRTDIEKTVGARPGDAVRVVDPRGAFVGVALWSSRSAIALRMLSRENRPVDELLQERLALAVELRKRIYPDADAIRLVHGEGDLLPGLVVDRYGDALSIQTLTEATDRRKNWFVERLKGLTGATVVVERNDVPARRHDGLEQTKGVLSGTLDGPVAYHEGDIELTADLIEGQKTGAFLDQRENHVLAGELASGRALDCFSYHGGFALQLARRAKQVTAVESSDKASEQIRANAKRNRLDNVDTVLANAFDYLRAQSDAGERYDTIVLDPPAFTKSKDSIPGALRGYKEINLRALSMLKPGGLLVSASCSYHIDEDAFATMLMSAARDAGRSLQLLEKRGAGRDHPVLMGVPETRYLKCFFVRAL